MKITFKAIVVTMFLGVMISQVSGQGFINLNFENATVVLADPPLTSEIVAINAIPGWTAYVNGGARTSIGYNGVSIGGAIVSLADTNASGSAPLPIQGIYSILLQGSPISAPESAGIGQTGTIPSGTQSLSFWGGYSGFQVTFNGQPVNYFATGGTANYNIYAADISAYAGQTGELLFTAPARTALLLDNIQFSSTAVPEPSASALIALGGLLLARRCWRKALV